MKIEELKDELAQSENYSVEPQKWFEHHITSTGVVFCTDETHIKSDTVCEVRP